MPHFVIVGHLDLSYMSANADYMSHELLRAFFVWTWFINVRQAYSMALRGQQSRYSRVPIWPDSSWWVIILRANQPTRPDHMPYQTKVGWMASAHGQNHLSHILWQNLPRSPWLQPEEQIKVIRESRGDRISEQVTPHGCQDKIENEHLMHFKSRPITVSLLVPDNQHHN